MKRITSGLPTIRESVLNDHKRVYRYLSGGTSCNGTSGQDWLPVLALGKMHATLTPRRYAEMLKKPVRWGCHFSMSAFSACRGRTPPSFPNAMLRRGLWMRCGEQVGNRLTLRSKPIAV